MIKAGLSIRGAYGINAVVAVLVGFLLALPLLLNLTALIDGTSIKNAYLGVGVCIAVIVYIRVLHALHNAVSHRKPSETKSAQDI